MSDYRWLVLIWRLPTGPSTPRVTVWRRLRRLGAVALTPGAAVVPYSDHLQEQLDWIADEVADLGGDAWVLPVGALPEGDESRIVSQALAERAEEYRRLEAQAATVGGDRSRRALNRRLGKVVARDHFGAPERSAAAAAVKQA
jgi:ChrB-like protein